MPDLIGLGAGAALLAIAIMLGRIVARPPSGDQLDAPWILVLAAAGLAALMVFATRSVMCMASPCACDRADGPALQRGAPSHYAMGTGAEDSGTEVRR